MKLCLQCKGLYAHDAQFCARCCQPLGVGIRCEYGHFTPGRNIHCCATCGSAEVSPGVPYLNLRWLSRTLSWTLVLVALRLVFGLGSLLQAAGTRLLDLVAGDRLVCQLQALLSFLVRIILVLWAGQLLLGRKPAQLVPSLHGIWNLLSAIGNLLLAALRALAKVIEGAPQKPKKSKKGGS